MKLINPLALMYLVYFVMSFSPAAERSIYCFSTLIKPGLRRS